METKSALSFFYTFLPLFSSFILFGYRFVVDCHSDQTVEHYTVNYTTAGHQLTAFKMCFTLTGIEPMTLSGDLANYTIVQITCVIINYPQRSPCGICYTFAKAHFERCGGWCVYDEWFAGPGSPNVIYSFQYPPRPSETIFMRQYCNVSHLGFINTKRSLVKALVKLCIMFS